MYKQYNWEFFPKINVLEFFDGDYNKIAKTLWYNSFKEILSDQAKTYELNRHNPFLIPNMDILVERIYQHVKNNSNILIFWDFDVDGISSSAVMLKWLYYAGANNLNVLIPNREVWYSIKREYILEYVNNPKNTYPDLIITVDCWIKSAQDIEYIVDTLWIEVLVTDHHGVDVSALPKKATTYVNPHTPWSKYPFKEISWSMVSLKVIEALEEYSYSIQWKSIFTTWPQGRANWVMSELQELAMLWTVADVMPILDENKWLVKDTLTRLWYSKNLWLRVFTNRLSKEYYDSGNWLINTDFIWWQIWPRINAAWRIWNPALWLNMFLTEEKSMADAIFDSLNSINKERQDILAEDYGEAVTNVKKWKMNSAIVYVEPNTADGIIWLIAWRLKEEFYRPAIAIWWKATVVDVEYGYNFTLNQEFALYKALFALNDRFYNKNSYELFHGASIKDNYKLMFSISEDVANIIENEFYSIFDNIENFVYTNLKELPEEEKRILILDLQSIDISSLVFNYYTVFKWSCRSIPWFDITKALDYLNKEYIVKNNEPLLLGFWWHPLAAWFWIKDAKIFEFKRLFENYANKMIDVELLKKEININLEVRDFSLINEKMVNMIYSMWPYGNRNEYPKILAIWKPLYAEVIWRKKTTVKMIFEDTRWVKLEILFFRYKDKEVIKNFCESIINNAEFRNYYYWIAWTLSITEYNNIKTVQLKPIDIVYNID